MFHWLHHLINPHCRECQMEAEENRICQSCETLKKQLELANYEKKQMLDTILSFSRPQAENQSGPPADLEHVKPKMMTWNVRRQMLEAEDRKAAQILAEQKRQAESIKELEKELSISEGAKNG